MNELESNIKALILKKYGSMKKFCETIDMPWTTLDSILKRGIANSNITNVLKITRELGLGTSRIHYPVHFSQNAGTGSSLSYQYPPPQLYRTVL